MNVEDTTCPYCEYTKKVVKEMEEVTYFKLGPRKGEVKKKEKVWVEPTGGPYFVLIDFVHGGRARKITPQYNTSWHKNCGPGTYSENEYASTRMELLGCPKCNGVFMQ